MSQEELTDTRLNHLNSTAHCNHTQGPKYFSRTTQAPLPACLHGTQMCDCGSCWFPLIHMPQPSSVRFFFTVWKLGQWLCSLWQANSCSQSVKVVHLLPEFMKLNTTGLLTQHVLIPTRHILTLGQDPSLASLSNAPGSPMLHYGRLAAAVCVTLFGHTPNELLAHRTSMVLLFF